MKNRSYKRSVQPHVLMITNHGIHDWEVRPGLTDTGGQNHYVCALTDTLVSMGCKVTVCNRGGFPDPLTGKVRRGFDYRNDYSRILYLEGGGGRFIRKEELDRNVLEEEADFAKGVLDTDGVSIDLIISHYWDGAILANLIKEQMGLSAEHLWIPHSLGALKRENMRGKPLTITAPLRFDKRIAYEREALKEVDLIASTSRDISENLKSFYGREADLLLPPCIDTGTIYPIDDVESCTRVFDFLREIDPLVGGSVRGRQCILEISRTDRTKRKDVVIEAFVQVLQDYPDTMLLLTASPDNEEVYGELVSLIMSKGIRDRVVLIGTVPRDIIAELYAIATVYVSPSEMEGFGMSVQEAAACKKAIVASDRVPFAMECLLRDAYEESVKMKYSTCTVRFGDGCAVVPAGQTKGFALAMKKLLSNESHRKRMAQAAYDVTIPHFTWGNMVKQLLARIGMDVPKSRG